MKGYIIFARVPDEEADEFEKQIESDPRLEQVFNRDETEEECEDSYQLLLHNI